MRQVGVLLVGSMGLVAIAQGAAPLATDDTGVLEARACEIEIYGQRQRATANDPVRAVSTAFGCGIGMHSQIGIGYARAASDGALDDAVGVSGKTGLFAADAASPFALALAWRLTALRVAGSGFRHEGSAITLVASRQLGIGITAHANLGWAHRRQTHASSTTWNLAAEAALGAGFEALAEVYGDDRGRPWRALGARWSPTERVGFGVAWAQPPAHPRSGTASAGVRLGF